MILLTVGTQLPFDRMVHAVDDWASENPGILIFGQIGHASYRPKHFEAAEFITPSDFAAMASAAELVVSHAGMGSIFTALQYGKPIVIMPRKACLGEHRNDHQLATAKRFLGRPGITVAFEARDLPQILARRCDLAGGRDFPVFATDPLISRLKNWLSALG